MNNIAVIGSSGTIGSAFVRKLSELYPEAQISGFSRNKPSSAIANAKFYEIDYANEESIANSAEIAAENAPLDLVIVATGILHNEAFMPEKSMKELSIAKFQEIILANTIFPALVAKHFLPKLAKDRRAVFAALSARVGSISDNQLGGWYSYRASKAALNMIIKNLSIEMKMRYKQGIIVGLHPGTVDSRFSKPFQANVPAGKLFTADYAVAKMLEVINTLTPENSGKCYAWDGEEILA